MSSMKRTMWPLPLQRRAIATMSCPLTPFLTTTLILMGAKPASCATSMPCNTTATGKSTSFVGRNTVSSSESSETLTRRRPAALNARAFLASSEALVGGQIQWFAGRRLSGGQHPDQDHEVFAQQGLAAGDADFLEAVCDEKARHARDFLKAQQFGSQQNCGCPGATALPDRAHVRSTHAPLPSTAPAASTAKTAQRSVWTGQAIHACHEASPFIILFTTATLT